jgi:hypothetical protein
MGNTIVLVVGFRFLQKLGDLFFSLARIVDFCPGEQSAAGKREFS